MNPDRYICPHCNENILDESIREEPAFAEEIEAEYANLTNAQLHNLFLSCRAIKEKHEDLAWQQFRSQA